MRNDDYRNGYRYALRLVRQMLEAHEDDPAEEEMIPGHVWEILKEAKKATPPRTGRPSREDDPTPRRDGRIRRPTPRRI